MRPPPPPPPPGGEKKTMWFIGVEVEQETSAPPPKKNPGSALAIVVIQVLLATANCISNLSFEFPVTSVVNLCNLWVSFSQSLSAKKLA